MQDKPSCADPADLNEIDVEYVRETLALLIAIEPDPHADDNHSDTDQDAHRAPFRQDVGRALVPLRRIAQPRQPRTVRAMPEDQDGFTNDDRNRDTSPVSAVMTSALRDARTGLGPWRKRRKASVAPILASRNQGMTVARHSRRLPSLVLNLLLLTTRLPLSVACADDCAKPSDQASMNVCARQEYERSDAELNALYKQITHRIEGDADTTKVLVAAQRAWMAFRDAKCAFSTAAAKGGTVYPILVARCRDGLTRTRIKDRKSYLHCAEGDLDCPVPAK